MRHSNAKRYLKFLIHFCPGHKRNTQKHWARQQLFSFTLHKALLRNTGWGGARDCHTLYKQKNGEISVSGKLNAEGGRRKIGPQCQLLLRSWNWYIFKKKSLNWATVRFMATLERRVWNKTGDTRIKTVKHPIIFLNWWYFQVCRLLSPGWDPLPVPLGGTSPFLRRGHMLSEARFGNGRFVCELYCIGNCICSKDRKLLEKWILSLKIPQISPWVHSRCLVTHLWVYYPQWFLYRTRGRTFEMITLPPFIRSIRKGGGHSRWRDLKEAQIIQRWSEDSLSLAPSPVLLPHPCKYLFWFFTLSQNSATV